MFQQQTEDTIYKTGVHNVESVSILIQIHNLESEKQNNDITVWP